MSRLGDVAWRCVVWCRQAMPYFETSAKDATRVETAFLEAATLALQQTSNDKDAE
jgi:hypothetical protein